MVLGWFGLSTLRSFLLANEGCRLESPNQKNVKKNMVVTITRKGDKPNDSWETLPWDVVNTPNRKQLSTGVANSWREYIPVGIFILLRIRCRSTTTHHVWGMIHGKVKERSMLLGDLLLMEHHTIGSITRSEQHGGWSSHRLAFTIMGPQLSILIHTFTQP